MHKVIINLTIYLIAIFRTPPHLSFLIGILFALIFKLDDSTKNLYSKFTKITLQLSIIFLGAKLDVATLFSVGEQGLILTLFSIIFVFGMGHFLSKFFKVSTSIGTLISSGTSICGGSAISAVAPVINANSIELATSMGVVFILNAISIFIFPPIAKILDLSQVQFGTWAALAIHDTSSVVAASQIYGEEALKVGTTLKLIRSLWIIPLVFFISFRLNKSNSVKIPWFIIGFIGFSLFFSYFDQFDYYESLFLIISKYLLSLTLFLIGLNLSIKQLTKIGLRPLMLGASLWFITILASLVMVTTVIK